MSYFRGYICTRVRQQDDGVLLVDRSTVATGENYWAAAREATDEPGAVVAVWLVDNLLIPGWKTASLGVEAARGWLENVSPVPNFLLVRAEFDLFFQIGAKGYTDLVRAPNPDPKEG